MREVSNSFGSFPLQQSVHNAILLPKTAVLHCESLCNKAFCNISRFVVQFHGRTADFMYIPAVCLQVFIIVQFCYNGTPFFLYIPYLHSFSICHHLIGKFLVSFKVHFIVHLVSESQTGTS